MRRAIARLIAVIGALCIAACGSQSGSIPGAGLRGPTYTRQAGEPRSASLQIASWPAQATDTVLHSFGPPVKGDGVFPFAGLTNVNGVLYGTTIYGGAHGKGTVFRITAAGVEKVIHSFGAKGDGATPYKGLINVNGVLYGTTTYGGYGCAEEPNGCGTVFKMTTSGEESVLYGFGLKGALDGRFPLARLTQVNGVLYGTTQGGGTGYCPGFEGGEEACGTVFRITTSGTESVLYSFAGGSDGINPNASVINVNGVLYSTTEAGGATGNGTVFKVTTSGAESVLYSFAGGSDGANPEAGLTDVDGVLYGTTVGGGGTVFSLTTSGQETVLHNFGTGSDGISPYAGLTNVNGVLYGTTFGGGANGYGTVFGITTSGTESVLYSFAGGNDGRSPFAGLTNVNGVLYGTTFYGGGANEDGTVFSFSL